MTEVIYDIVGIGIGPFNLGLAALAADIKSLKCIFFEQKKEFGWHEGMLIHGATLQVPFYADLVTLAHPESRFSYLSFLKKTGNLFRFGIRENIYPARFEYNEYCKWVSRQLNSLHFARTVTKTLFNISHSLYEIYVSNSFNKRVEIYYAKKIVIGVGSVPLLPAFIKNLDSDRIIHSSDYCFKKKKILKSRSVCIIGSGQSAAEIFYDLLHDHKHFTQGLSWITRSERFSPMDYSKFSLEMTSPEFINFFYSLQPHMKDKVNTHYKYLYKGINQTLIEAIYNHLYLASLHEPIGNVRIQSNAELRHVTKLDNQQFILRFFHMQKKQSFDLTSSFVILASGYAYRNPAFIQKISDKINFDNKNRYVVNKNYSIDKDGNSIFVQNAELHTHGFNTPDLGMGPYRNAIILNEILGYQHFEMNEQPCFQSFNPGSDL